MTKHTDLFPPEIRTAAIIPRWSVVWTLNKDTVSNHSFFVTFYSRQIAKLIDWKGDLSLLMFLALVHDLDETLTGDIVSPVKHEILDPERYRAYVKKKMGERFPGIVSEITPVPEGSLEATGDAMMDMQYIIKVADRLDGLFYLLGERRMGNTIIEERATGAHSLLYQAWKRLPVSGNTGASQLDALWHSVMLPVIAIHERTGGLGV